MRLKWRLMFRSEMRRARRKQKKRPLRTELTRTLRIFTLKKLSLFHPSVNGKEKNKCYLYVSLINLNECTIKNVIPTEPVPAEAGSRDPGLFPRRREAGTKKILIKIFLDSHYPLPAFTGTNFAGTSFVGMTFFYTGFQLVRE